MLTATNLTKSYSGVQAIQNVSLTLEGGQIMALVGASGSGKSTLLTLLAGLADADEGEIYLDEKRVLGPLDVLVPGHEDIRLVPQEYQLMPNVSVRENVAYALRFYEKSYRDFRVDELLKLCRLATVQDRLPRQVSGGEKQRTAIARAIAEKPTEGRTVILLLDEPFSHLDLPNRLIVRDLLFDLVRQENTPARSTACLFVTHDATDALSIADTLGILRDGQLIQVGSPVDIYHHPITAYAAQMTGLANVFKAIHLSLLNHPVGPDSEQLVCIRPEQLALADSGTPATIQAVFFKGSHYEIEVALSHDVYLRLLTTRTTLRVGESVHVQLQADTVWWLKG